MFKAFFVLVGRLLTCQPLITGANYIAFNDKGDKFYYKDKKKTILHRVDGPAIELADGTKSWYLNGKPHRFDGPAAEWADGYKEWWVNGKRHREDGPAIEWAKCSKFWFLNGKKYTEAEFKAIVNNRK